MQKKMEILLKNGKSNLFPRYTPHHHLPGAVLWGGEIGGNMCPLTTAVWNHLGLKSYHHVLPTFLNHSLLSWFDLGLQLLALPKEREPARPTAWKARGKLAKVQGGCLVAPRVKNPGHHPTMGQGEWLSFLPPFHTCHQVALEMWPGVWLWGWGRVSKGKRGTKSPTRPPRHSLFHGRARLTDLGNLIRMVALL